MNALEAFLDRRAHRSYKSVKRSGLYTQLSRIKEADRIVRREAARGYTLRELTYRGFGTLMFTFQLSEGD